MYVDMAQGEALERVHTGEGVMIVPCDVYATLNNAGLLSDFGEKGKGLGFTGKYGDTFLIVRCLDAPKKRKSVVPIEQRISEERKITMRIRYVNAVGLCKAEHYSDIPDHIRERLEMISYYDLIKPLWIYDYGQGMKANRLAIKYDIDYRTFYKWIHGR